MIAVSHSNCSFILAGSNKYYIVSFISYILVLVGGCWMVDLRIYEHPVISFRRGRRIRFYYEDRVVEAFEGESILAALYAAGYRVFSYSPDGSRPRGAFCMIGKCGSCSSIVDGVPNTRICIEPVREGVRVYRQKGLPQPPTDLPEPEPPEKLEVDVDTLIIGGGPAGLEAARILGDLGYNVAIVDDHFRIGGQLVKQTHRFFGDRKYYGGLRGYAIPDKIMSVLGRMDNVKVFLRTFAYGFFRGNIVGAIQRGGRGRHIVFHPKTIIAGTGALEKTLWFENNDLPGIMGAGGAQTLMNEYGVRPGDRALIVGSGNVGLIVTYQLLQAGVRVVGLAEIMDHIGGWFVHAAKIRRLGVPFYLRHTITKAYGRDRVEAAEISMVDENYKPIPGSEKKFDVDLVLLAVGLQPNYTFFTMAGAAMKYIPELGGLVPVRTLDQETSVPGLYVAGDASGVEEATTAFIEGGIAAYSAAIRMGCSDKRIVEEREKLKKFLWEEYRMSPVVSRSREGKLKAIVTPKEMEEIRRHGL
jgi:sarcosine oxidase subunit alpha